MLSIINNQEVLDNILTESFYNLIDINYVKQTYRISSVTARKILVKLNLQHIDASSLTKIKLHLEGFSNTEIKSQLGLKNNSSVCSVIRKFRKDNDKKIEEIDRYIANKLGVDYYRYGNAIKFNVNKFNCIDSEDSAYWFGYLNADGNIHKAKETTTLTLGSIDKDILIKFNAFMERDQIINTINNNKGYGNNKPFYTLTISNSQLIKNLNNLGLFANKTISHKFPEIPNELLKHFIRGYFDGNGSFSKYHSYCKKLSKTHTKYCFSLEGTEEFILQLQTILKNKFNKEFYLCKRFETTNCSTTIKGSGRKNTLDFLNWIYEDAIIYMDRKYNKYLQLM